MFPFLTKLSCSNHIFVKTLLIMTVIFNFLLSQEKHLIFEKTSDNHGPQLILIVTDIIANWRYEMAISLRLIQDNHQRAKQLSSNKKNHMINGNIKNKAKKYLKVMEFNKGSSLFNTNIEILKLHISDQSPSVCIYVESNSEPGDNLHKSFPQYNILHKAEPNHPLDRVVMLVHKDVEFKRLPNLEDPNISSIWIKAKTGKKQYTIICGYYRQWRIPHEANISNSGTTDSQVSRFNTLIDQVKRAKQISDRIVMLGYTNIDTSGTRDISSRPELKALTPILEEFLNNEAFSIMNQEFTRFQSNCRPSTIDHIITNIPGHIDNVRTLPGIISDHKIISCLLHTEILTQHPMYIYKTNWWKIQPDVLMQMITENKKIMNSLTKTDPDAVWADIIEGLNEIINTLAPTKVIQCKSKYMPYVGKEVEEFIEDANLQLEKAIVTNDAGEWRLFRCLRNQVGKLIKKSKRIYYLEKITNKMKMWSSLKELAGQDKITTPRTIIHEGDTVTSPKELAEILNNHFIETVKTTREEFPDPRMSPIEILEKTMPRPDTTLKIKETTVEKTRKYINESKSTNTLRFDRITSRIIKMSAPIMSVILTHAINCSIRRKKFPKVLKISRILPILKSNKNPMCKDSYRPISNLHSLEKVYEQHLKTELENYFYGNEIIIDNHHGGRKDRKTITEKTEIDAKVAKITKKRI